MVIRLVALACLVSGSLLAAAFPMFFEPLDGRYTASSRGQTIEISERGWRISAAGSTSSLSLRWLGAGHGTMGAAEPAQGVTNYFEGPDAGNWRPGVTHCSKVQVIELYRNVDVAYYFHDERLEFDLRLRPGSDSGMPRFGLHGAAHPIVEAGGGLKFEADGRSHRFRAPSAYQIEDGVRVPVECRYRVDASQRVGFRLGEYDRRRELIIDPVLEVLTYLGGSGADQIQAIGADQAGNIVVAGITNSTNSPGMGAPAGSVSIFVTKLNSTGSAVLFTTIIGSSQTAITNVSEKVSSLAVDTDGSIYVTGETYAPNFPTSAGAWQQNSTGGFVTRLNNSGQVVYSTLLGPPTWGLTALRVRVLNGTAYLAGNVSSANFFGTSGVPKKRRRGPGFLRAGYCGRRLRARVRDGIWRLGPGSSQRHGARWQRQYRSHRNEYVAGPAGHWRRLALRSAGSQYRRRGDGAAESGRFDPGVVDMARHIIGNRNHGRVNDNRNSIGAIH